MCLKRVNNSQRIPSEALLVNCNYNSSACSYLRRIKRHSVLFLLPPAVSAGERILLDESFSGEAIPKPWKPSGRKNSFSIIDSALRGVAAADDGHGPTIGVPIEGRDLTLEFDFKFTKPGYFLCLIDGDSQFAGQAHLLRFAATKTQVQLMQDRGDPVSKKKQKAERDRNGGKRIPATRAQLADPTFYRIERLATHAATAADGKWHHVIIELRGNRVTAKFDATKMSAAGTVLDEKKSRLVFLVGQTGDIRIDNVKLRTLVK